MPAAGKPRFCIQRGVVESNNAGKQDSAGLSRVQLGESEVDFG